MSAFTAVSARRTVGPNSYPPPPAPAMQPTPAPAQTKITFPPALRAYVQRAFAEEHKIPGITPEDMQARLKEVINTAANTYQLDSIDWVNYPLPQQMIKSERGLAGGPTFAPAASFSNLHLHQQPPRSSTNIAASPSKKRKSNDHSDSDSNLPPWRKDSRAEPSSPPSKDDSSSRNSKRKRFQADIATLKDSSKFDADLERRRRRFDNGNDSPTTPTTSTLTPPPQPQGPVVGTQQKLEKRYLRLTSAPNPDQVRPLAVLKQTLELLKSKWKEQGDYNYICDQFKSLRQDLTVQHIKNEFTVKVYEVHARIALEKGDLGEYNQCQTQLRALYKHKLGGHPAEFLAYRILYLIYTCNRTDMSKLLAELTPADRAHAEVRHALRTRSALALGDYHRFFRLYMDMPNMGAYLVDMFVDRERLSALASMCKVYKPDLALRFVTEELGFESDQHTVEFLCAHGASELVQKGTSEGEPIRLLAGKAGPKFEQAKQAAFRQIDIKGQL